MPSLKPSVMRRIGNTWRLSKKRKNATVDMTEDGFVFNIGRVSTPIRWSDVIEIDVGVRDFVAYDTFYVVLRTHAAEVTIEEFNDGFRQLEYTILERWPAFKDRWQSLFSLPLHQAHYEVLWRKDGAR
jgi:hypothetical protein